MNSALASAASYSTFTLSSSPLSQSNNNSKLYTGVNFRPTRLSFTPIRVQASQNNGSDGDMNRIRLVHKLKKAAGLVVMSAAIFGRLGQYPARAEVEQPTVTEQVIELVDEESEKAENLVTSKEVKDDEVKVVEEVEASPLAKLIETSPEAIEALKRLLGQKLDNGEDQEALKLLNQLIAAQPSEVEWKYMKARLLNEMNLTDESRVVFEELLAADPLNYETLFENALLMNRLGEGEAVIRRLEEAVRIAEEMGKGKKEGRDVRMMLAQMKFLQNNVDGALSDYDRLIEEDPSDFRPYYTKGFVYSVLKMNDEAKEEVEKYRKLSPSKAEVEEFLKAPLSRMLIFGTSEQVV